jgi:membrane-bound serine protease (ClpP class)
MRIKTTIILLLWGLALLVQPTRAQSNEILILQIEAPVTPVMLTYFERGVNMAERRNSDALLVVLDTPGGAVDVMIEIVELFRNSPIPIIVYIGPNGAQAASAGSVITAAAHAAAMAPETVIGAASPINGDGSNIEETLYRKQVNDLKATMRSLTERRGATAVALAESMIEDATAVTAAEALDAGFIDVIATDLDSLLPQLDGLEVVVNNEPITLKTANVSRARLELSFIERALALLANPLLVGVLLAIGVQALIFEVTNPGGWAAGFLGLLLIGLAMFGLNQLPVNWLGMGLVLAAFILFIAEALTSASGPLAAVGSVTLLAGLLVLFNSPGTPEFARISISGAVTITALTAGFFFFLVMKIVQSRNFQPVTGAEGMIGQTAVARADFIEKEAAFAGTVLVHGEIWRALADEAVADGDAVIVKMIDGFTLKVKKA